jgi:hypothetical protein
MSETTACAGFAHRPSEVRTAMSETTHQMCGFRSSLAIRRGRVRDRRARRR